MPRRVAELMAGAALAGLLGLGGCGATSPARVGQGAGGSWQAVLPGPRVAALSAEQGRADWTATRNDERLNVRPVEPLLATTAWPERERPTVRRPVLIRVHRRPEGFIYYRTEERYEYRRGW